MSEEEALKRGMEEKSKEFVEKGAEEKQKESAKKDAGVYAKV